MAGYTPVFNDVYNGTLYGRWPAAAVWATLLPLADRHGQINGSAPSICAYTGWPENLFDRGLAILLEPDPESRCRESGGRRLLVTSSGWSVVGWPCTAEFDFRPLYGRLPSNEWSALRSEIFERDDYTCRYCGARGGALECDHVIPVAKGGSNRPGNLTTACRTCNRAKHAKTLKEWIG